MGTICNKIDFAGIIIVKNANCNGDPLNGNIPRTTYNGLGEISDVCLKRKVRNRLQDMGEKIFVQSDDRSDDGCKSLKERAEANAVFGAELKKGKKANKDVAYEAACKEWVDVRCFGQVFALKNTELSLGIRGPVSMQSAFSVDPVDITSLQITKSVNSESTGGEKASDTMGMKHRVDFGVYILKGSINVQLAEKTGFTDQDAETFREALRTIFVNDASSARPDGSMELNKLYWWKHNNKIGQYSSKKVHDSLIVEKKESVTGEATSINDYNISLMDLEGLEVEVYEGL